ncbi:disks large homolog 5-like [Rattus norvegicus]|uniref:disks large homolog 5-like n=1 Tax=Rattus norvegicus TaxID=10116 RepID=UPI0019173220|nr:disks large homolog 5-like [Rattus norvegicus]
MGSRGGMFSRILSLFRRDNHIPAETTPRQREASLLSRWRTRRMERSWRRSKSDQKASSQPSTTPVEEERMKRLENLKIALHKMQKLRDELRRILADYPGKNLNDRNNFESEMLMRQHEEVMTDMKKMSEQINYALVKCKNLTLENDWYCHSFYPLLTEFFEVKNNAQRAMNENRELLWDQIALEESIKETTRFCGDASMKIRVPSSLRSEHSCRSLPRTQTRTTALRDRPVHQEH